MVNVHMIVGTITLVLFIINCVMYGMEMSSGRVFPIHRIVSIAAATGLLLQYALGFSLLADSHRITMWHYLSAFAAIFTVGYEHMATAKESTVRGRSQKGLIASLLTTLLVLAAYGIAEMR